MEKRWEDAYGKNIAPGASSVDVVLEQFRKVTTVAMQYSVEITVRETSGYQAVQTCTQTVNQGDVEITWSADWSKDMGNLTFTGLDGYAYELTTIPPDGGNGAKYTLTIHDVSGNLQITAMASNNTPAKNDVVINGLNPDSTTALISTGVTHQVTLSSANDWTYNWTVKGDKLELNSNILPQYDTDGTEFVYRIREATNTPGYQVTYYNNSGILHGTILVTNTREETGFTTLEFPVTKQWLTADGTEDGADHNETVTFAVYQKAQVTEPDSIFGEYAEDDGWSLVNTYSISQDTGWTTNVTDLPKSYTDADGKTKYYVYCVREIKAEQTLADGTKIDQLKQYDVTVTTGEDGVTIQNKAKQPGYELPETGGGGTIPWLLAGAAVLAAAGTYGIRAGRRRRRRQ